MTNRGVAAIAAGVLAIGLVTGAAGAVLIGNATSQSTGDSVSRMSQMHDYMDDVFRSGPGQGMMGSGSVRMPLHAQHHGVVQP